MRVAMRHAAWAVVLCCVMSSSALAQGRGTIAGRVIGPGNAPQPNVNLVVTSAATGIDRRGVSEPTGEFVFGGLAAGTYRLRVDDETFAPWSQDGIVVAGGATVQIAIQLQSRVAAQATPTQRATIAGTVIGPQGRPLGNATVILTNAAGIDRRGVSEPSGAYVFGGLPPGTYRLRIEEAGALPFASGDLALAPGEQRPFDIRLQPVPVPPVLTPPAGATAPGGVESPRAPAARTRAPRAARSAPDANPVPEVTAGNGEFEAMPDRWKFAWPGYERYAPPQRMPWTVGSPLDPYNQNVAKGDFPIANGLFANVNLQFNSTVNPREVSNAAFSSEKQLFYNQNLVAGLELFKGDTVFEPKRWAVRATAVVNTNANKLGSFGFGDPGSTYALEEAFVEKRLAVTSPAFDFVSVRGGMQNFNSDFRGYLFVDNQLGVRLFGNAGSNRSQYNVAYFLMRNRDAASQLHDFTNRNQQVLIANYYIQDFGARGYTGMFNVHLNRDQGTEDDPNALQVVYLGFHGDGRWGSWGVSHAFYQAFGSDDDNRIARVLNGGGSGAVNINARMAALELSRDADWKRYRFSVLYASGDNRADPGTAHGFDTITDNPNLAGGQFMFWTQQSAKIIGLPFDGLLSEKFSLMPNLRSKFTDRANFVNPGLILLNAGVDLRLSPALKVVTNVSQLRFADATVLQLLTAGQPGFEDNNIGWDISAGAKFRPFVNENLFVVSGFSLLKPSGGFQTAVGSGSKLFSVFGALQIAY